MQLKFKVKIRRINMYGKEYPDPASDVQVIKR
uniref:Uncharacterized protein n=1 Tax=Arundo donax TaxID=35708 RepID=A0A0A8ZGK7_ARUDO